MKIATIACLSFCLAACQVPKHIGDGTLCPVGVPLGLTPTTVTVSPGEKWVLVETSGDKNFKLLLEENLDGPLMNQYEWETFAFGPEGRTIACITPLDLVVLEVPKLKVISRSKKPIPGASMDERITALPDGGGFVVTSSNRPSPNVWIVAGDPPVFGRSGRTAMKGDIGGRAIDNRTGLLLLLDKKNRLELFDLTEMKSVAVLELPCRETSGGIAAHEGKAWIGTRGGKMIPVDLPTQTVAAPVGLGGPGDVLIDYSLSGGLLAVAVQDRSGAAPPYSTELKVFIREGEGLYQLDSAFMQLDEALGDIAVSDTTDQVLMTVGKKLYCWRFGGRPR